MLKVLLVDDDAVSLMLHTKLLEKANLPFPIHQFKSGAEVLGFLQSQGQSSADFLLLLDINMPEISGWDVLDVLTKTPFPFQVFVFMVTSSVDQADLLKSKLFDLVLGYIEKPLNKSTLEEIRNHSSLQRYFKQAE